MAETRVTIVYWRDMPSQVIAKRRGETQRLPLSARFQEAIDMAAMRGGAESADAYMDGWRHGEPESVNEDPITAADTVAAQLEAAYGAQRLRALVRGAGHEKV